MVMMGAAEFDVQLQQYGKQVAYYAITKGGMADDEQWEYATKQWPLMNHMGIEKILRYAAIEVRAHLANAAQLLKDFA